MLFDAFESVPDEDVASTCSGWLKSWGLHHTVHYQHYF